MKRYAIDGRHRQQQLSRRDYLHEVVLGMMTALSVSPRLAGQDKSNPGTVPRHLEGHSDNVYALQFDPQGRWLVSASEDATLRVWDWPAGKLRHRLRGEDAFYDLVFNPKDQHLFACDGGGRLHRVDPVAGRFLHSWKSHAAPVYALAVTSQARLLAAGGDEHDPLVRLWTLPDLRDSRTLKGHTDAIYGLAFSADGRWLASASADRTVRIWNPANGQLCHTLVHGNYVYRCRFAPGQPLLATACHDKRLRLWHVPTGQCLASFTEAKGPLFAVAFTADGQLLLAAGEDRHVRVYHVERRRLITTVNIAKDVVYALALATTTPTGLAIAGGESRISIYPWPLGMDQSERQ
ncbi:MAG: WD40 repeat domain-containing protein [Gemmataceae bacterium]|nr:WD40 repeat domain-containing protein [Gemmataceae bacterium]MDW8242764.1 WD40 repeat domain-containing protein [Thermogemmata sp.]